MSLANTIRTLGHDITDAQIVKKMLQVVQEHLEQIACSIETLLDVDDLSIKERYEQREKEKTPKEQYCLFTWALNAGVLICGAR